MTIDIEALNSTIDQYDEALTQTLIERDDENSKALFNYHRLGNILEKFAKDNQTWDYQRHLTKERADHLGYYYSDNFILTPDELEYKRRAIRRARAEAREAEYNQYYR